MKINLLTIVEIILLIAIVIFIGKISLMLKNHYEAFDENPFLFGAKKYNVGICSCVTDKQVSFFFNQTAMWQEIKTHRPMQNITELINNLDNLVIEDGSK